MGWQNVKEELKTDQFNKESTGENLRLMRKSIRLSKCTIVVAILTLAATLYFGMK